MIKLIAVCLMFISVSASAESSLLNFGDFFVKARAGYFVNQHLEKSGIAYSAVQRLHTTAGIELVNFNFGYNSTLKRATFPVGVRADSIIPMLWGGTWGKAHVTTANLPAIEFGPAIVVSPKVVDKKLKLDFQYGVFLAVGFAQ